MKDVPHEITNVAKLGDTTDQPSSGSEYTIQRTNIREAKIKRRAIVESVEDKSMN